MINTLLLPCMDNKRKGFYGKITSSEFSFLSFDFPLKVSSRSVCVGGRRSHRL
uniref:Uncharacterized protein n=1 Tax=Rhizophora mucronata TaxID=61149 RepID=A0A2P2KZ80_RHIMU